MNSKIPSGSSNQGPSEPTNTQNPQNSQDPEDFQPEESTNASPNPDAAVVTSNKSRNGFKVVVIALVILAIAGGLAYALSVANKPAKTTSTAVTAKKDIPKLSIGVINGTIALYPDGQLDSYALGINSQIYEGLVQYRQQTKLQPLLATGWSNPNNSTWDFDLRHSVSFHNGHTLTADDVVYSLQLAQKNADIGSTFANTIASVKALSPYKVEVTTTSPDPFFLNKMSFVMIVDAKAANATDTMNGTGPYELKTGTKPTDSTISLTAYDHYHGGHVYTRALDFKIEATQEDATTDFKKGAVNMAGEYITKNTGLSGIMHTSTEVDDTAVSIMQINSVSPGPLQKQQVREALRDSLDIAALIKSTDRAATPSSQLMTQAIPGYNPSLPTPKQDIAKAKSLLAQAGYPSGVPLTLEVGQHGVDIAKGIAQQAAAAGFTITVKEQDDFNQLITDSQSLKSQLVSIGYSSDVLDGSDVFSTVLQSAANYKSPTLDSYLKQASATIDQTQRLKILQNASKYVYDSVAAIPLYHVNRTWITDRPYALQFDSQSGSPGAYFWQVYATK